MGYFDNKPNPDPNAILFASNPDAFQSHTVSVASLLLSSLLSAMIFGVGGYYFAKNRSSGRYGPTTPSSYSKSNSLFRSDSCSHAYVSIDSNEL